MNSLYKKPAWKDPLPWLTLIGFMFLTALSRPFHGRPLVAYPPDVQRMVDLWEFAKSGLIVGLAWLFAFVLFTLIPLLLWRSRADRMGPRSRRRGLVVLVISALPAVLSLAVMIWAGAPPYAQR